MSEHCEHAWVGDSECAYCEIVRLRDLIHTHNASCENACAARSDAHCEPWLTRGRWCPDCPREWMIESEEQKSLTMHDAMVTNRHSAAWLRAMREIEAEGSPSPAAHCPPPAGIEAAAAMWRSGGAAPPSAIGGARPGVRAPTPVWWRSLYLQLARVWHREGA